MEKEVSFTWANVEHSKKYTNISKHELKVSKVKHNKAFKVLQYNYIIY